MATSEQISKRAETTSNLLKETVHKTNMDNIALNNNKLSVKDFDTFVAAYETRITTAENTNDSLWTKLTELQNWIDVYMPLRI